MDELGAGVRPVILGCALRQAQGLGDFNVGHAHKTTQLHHLSLDGVDGGELVERLVHGEALVVVARAGHFNTSPTWRIRGGRKAQVLENQRSRFLGLHYRTTLARWPGSGDFRRRLGWQLQFESLQ